WLRLHVKDRLSVALMAGQLDANLAELQRYREPVLRAEGVRNKLWVVPRLGSAGPAASSLEEAWTWLGGGGEQRRAPPGARGGAGALLLEADRRLQKKASRDEGIVLLEAVSRAVEKKNAAEAKKRLAALAAKGVKWRDILDGRQQAHLSRDARALDAWIKALPLTVDLRQRALLRAEAVKRWEEVKKLGADTREGREAAARLKELKRPGAW